MIVSLELLVHTCFFWTCGVNIGTTVIFIAAIRITVAEIIIHSNTAIAAITAFEMSSIFTNPNTQLISTGNSSQLCVVAVDIFNVFAVKQSTFSCSTLKVGVLDKADSSVTSICLGTCIQ